MKILGLNCQGLGNALTVLALLDTQKRHNPEVMFLSVTHLDDYPAECLRRRLKMDLKIVSPSEGRSGGVILFWRKDIVIQQKFSHPKYIDVRVIEGPDKIWRLTGIYGEPRWEDKHKTWDKLRELHGVSNLPWAIIGDFNEILFSHEKEGGNRRPHRCMDAFREALVDCELEDLGFYGEIFTWKRGRIRERLDRVVANGAWSLMHPSAGLVHLDYIKSDHRPILLDTEHHSFMEPRQSKQKKFEAKWLHEKVFSEEVQRAWNLAGTENGVLARLSRMHDMLHAWDIRVLQPKRRLRMAQRELQKSMDGPISDENETKAKEMANLIELLLEQEEIYWSQRSRANWIQFEDRNTSIFTSLLPPAERRII